MCAVILPAGGKRASRQRCAGAGISFEMISRTYGKAPRGSRSSMGFSPSAGAKPRRKIACAARCTPTRPPVPPTSFQAAPRLPPGAARRSRAAGRRLQAPIRPSLSSVGCPGRSSIVIPAATPHAAAGIVQFRTRNTTRRFCCRPSSVLLLATGWRSPYPREVSVLRDATVLQVLEHRLPRGAPTGRGSAHPNRGCRCDPRLRSLTSG